jgi:uncharacterized RDD family membrane protein YckC
MDFEPAYNRYSLAQMGQRVAASGIDIVACLMLSSFLEALVGIDAASGAGELIFCFVWLFNRVLLPTKNQGQSVGRWAMNLRVVDMEFGNTANIAALVRREAAILIAMLIWISSLDSLTGAVILALVPVVVDIAPAFVDIDRRQALHDKIGGTIVINSRKGFELEQKLLSFFGQANKFVRSSRQSLQQRSGQYGDRSGYPGYQENIYQDPYANRAQRQRYPDAYGNSRNQTRTGYNAPASYGQAYREEIDPDNYAGYGDYDDAEPWDETVDYDDYGQVDDLDAELGPNQAHRSRGQTNPLVDRYDRTRQNRQTSRGSRGNDQDWGDDAQYDDRYDDGYIDQVDDLVDDRNYSDPTNDDRYADDYDLDPRDRPNRRDPRPTTRKDDQPPRRRPGRGSSNQQRSPRRRNQY